MEKKKVLVADPISEKGIAELIATPELDVVVKLGISPEELLATASQYHGIVVRSETAGFFKQWLCSVDSCHATASVRKTAC